MKKERRILCLSDSKNNLQRYLDLKNDPAFKTHWDDAVNGLEAALKSEENLYDLIISDHLAATYAGEGFIKSLRRKGGLNESTPILIQTGENGPKQSDEKEVYYLAQDFRGQDLVDLSHKVSSRKNKP